MLISIISLHILFIIVSNILQKDWRVTSKGGRVSLIWTLSDAVLWFIHWWDEISSKSIEDNKNAAFQALVGVHCTILGYEQIMISISKNKIDIFRFTLSWRWAWVQTDKISSLKLRAGMGQSCWSIEQFMSQINSVCETCWELQCSSHRQLWGVFASNCRPRREKSDLDNKLLAYSGDCCVSL